MQDVGIRECALLFSFGVWVSRPRAEIECDCQVLLFLVVAPCRRVLQMVRQMQAVYSFASLCGSNVLVTIAINSLTSDCCVQG